MTSKSEADRNEASVRAIYEAYASGDLASITQFLSKDVRWDEPAQSVDLDWLRPRRGHDGVEAFFQSLEQLEFVQFLIKEILSCGNVVIALIDIRAIVLKTGRTICDEDEVHIWRFGPDNLVSQFRHKLDTHQHVLAAYPR